MAMSGMSMFHWSYKLAEVSQKVTTRLALRPTLLTHTGQRILRVYAPKSIYWLRPCESKFLTLRYVLIEP